MILAGREYKEDDIAIIGISGRFPEADTLEEFWANLASGRDSIREYPESRREELGELFEEINEITFSRAGYLNQVTLFEPQIFFISQEECKYIDPQHRLILELVEEAILDAGYNPQQLSEKNIGVFIAGNQINYTEKMFSNSAPLAFVNSIMSLNSGRVSYTYNFHGPVLTLDTSCSSSLVALHYACQSLKLGEADMVIAGGAHIMLLPLEEKDLHQQNVLSLEQKIRTFDKNADGTVPGEGGGIVLLKLLKQAMKDGDPIQAIIKGSSVNSNGNWSNGIAAPSEKGQADAILKALTNAQVEASSISYLEAHGTGTKVGDPIEVAGISRAFKQFGCLNQSIPIGSLKSNIGHLDSAAGIANVIKIVLAFKHEQLPPSINFETPNPLIDFGHSPVYVNQLLSDWKPEKPRRAGVTSLGLTGTNCHMILEEAPEVTYYTPSGKSIITLSARTGKSLGEMAENLCRYLKSNLSLPLADVAYTLNTGRRDFKYKFLCEAQSRDELLEKLTKFTHRKDVGGDNGEYEAFEADPHGKISAIFIFPDLGAVDFSLRKDTYHAYPNYQKCWEQCQNLIRERNLTEDSKTHYLFHLYSCSKLLEAYSIKPKAVFGFGMGDLVADLVMGKQSLEDTLQRVMEYKGSGGLVEEAKLNNLIDRIIHAGVNTFIILSFTAPLESVMTKLIRVRGNISVYSLNSENGKFYRMVAGLMKRGLTIDWKKVYEGELRRRVSLPGYSFDRKPYFAKPDDLKSGFFHTLPGYQKEMGYNFHTQLHGSRPERETLCSILSELSPRREFTLTNNIYDLGLDSISMMQFAAKVNDLYNIHIPTGVFFESNTIGELFNLIESSALNQVETHTRIKRQPEQDFYPLSSSQRRLFILEQFRKDNTSYNMPQAVTIKGVLEKEKFERALQKLIERQEVLRTSFEMVDGQPVQRIHGKVEFTVEFRMAERDEIDSIIKQFIRPFDLKQAPLFRIMVLQIAEAEQILLYDIHHIIFDGISAEVLVGEMMKLYAGEVLPKLPIRYRDYAVWQSDRLASNLLKSQEVFWLEIFSGKISALALPTDYPRKLLRSFLGASIWRRLEKDRVSSLEKYAESTGATLYMILLAVYNVLLARYTGQEEIVVGSPISGRHHGEMENLIGVFINTIALRNHPEGIKSFTQFLAEVKDNCLKAYENQEYPFEELVEKLNLPRDMNRNPLFDTMFALQTRSRNKVVVNGLELLPYELQNRQAKFDLTLFVFPQNDTLLLELEYDSELFKKETMERLIGHYINILDQALSNPEVRLGEIQMLSEAEQRSLLFDYNRTNSQYPLDKTICDLFAEQVARTPDHIAVAFADLHLCYRELNIRANQLAALLRDRGAGPGVVIGIMAERSMEFVISILAILKAGAAYLPIDPHYPVERVHYMLNDSAVDILLTNKALANEGYFSGEIIYIEDPGLYRGDGANPRISACAPKDLAYIIYTSGSTGKPKGVIIEHRGLVNYVWWAAKSYLHNEALSFPFYTSISFDLTVTSLFVPLISGGRVVVYGDDHQGWLIEKVLRDNQVDIIKATPSHLKVIKTIDNSRSRVKGFIVGGEQLEISLAQEIQRSFGDRIEIYNEYGPTETVVGCMIHQFDPALDVGPAVPIGVPGDNVQIYLLNQALKPVPVNVEGEIYISGDGVARGYINAPELTAERFIPNPFVPGVRMYRTGDMGRMLPGGKMVFIGRIDFQVKIRGYRIELGEIENRIIQHPAVKAAVVVERDAPAGSRYLCAYIVSDKDLTALELREYLCRELPDYMIPSAFISVESIPLTPNGKIDRTLLSIYEEGNLNSGVEYVAPGNEIEEKLVSVWKEVLGSEGVGVNDNFFVRGGDSLKAIQVIMKLALDFEVNISDIFAYQTIAELSKNIRFKKDSLKDRVEKLNRIKKMDLSPEEAVVYEVEAQKILSTEYQQYYERNQKYQWLDLSLAKPYQNILLAGATGYLGIYLLNRLLEKTHYKLFPLVRGENVTVAMERLINRYRYYFGYNPYDRFPERLCICNGDLTRDNLGMAPETYSMLSEQIDCIINSAANVRHYGLYQEFFGINVKGTERLLEFAQHIKSKDYHHISTSSIGAGNLKGKLYTLFTEYECDMGQETGSYYLETKLMAEKLVISSRTRGINSNIYRVGNLVFDSTTGKFQENIDDNGFYNTIKSFVKLGVIPELIRKTIEFSFVDYVSDAMVLLFSRENLQNETYHLINPHNISLREVGSFIQKWDPNIRLSPFGKFLEYVFANYDSPQLQAYIDRILLHSFVMERLNETNCFIVCDKTNLILNQMGFYWTAVLETHIRKMLEHCVQAKFI